MSRFETPDGLDLYYEVHGEGEPLVLLHGGVLSVEDLRELAEPLAASYRVIVLDQQGHGRSTDTDREIRPETLAADVVALLDHLGLADAHVFGHSMGGAAATQLLVDHPTRVRSAVLASTTVRPEGTHPDLASPEAMATSTRMPTLKDFTRMRTTYERLSPTPDGFDAFMAKMQNGEAFYRGWTDEQLAGIAAPVLFVIGDHDFTTVEHLAVMLAKVPGSQGAVLPGTTHMQVTHRPAMLVPMIAAFHGGRR